MNPTLQQLFYGDLCPRQENGRDNLGCSTIYESISNQQKKFREALEEQAPKLVPKFEVLTNDYFLSYNRQTEAMFHRGFGLAVKLIAEALAV